MVSTWLLYGHKPVGRSTRPHVKHEAYHVLLYFITIPYISCNVDTNRPGISIPPSPPLSRRPPLPPLPLSHMPPQCTPGPPGPPFLKPREIIKSCRWACICENEKKTSSSSRLQRRPHAQGTIHNQTRKRRSRGWSIRANGRATNKRERITTPQASSRPSPPQYHSEPLPPRPQLSITTTPPAPPSVSRQPPPPPPPYTTTPFFPHGAITPSVPYQNRNGHARLRGEQICSLVAVFCLPLHAAMYTTNLQAKT